jgi:UDP-N-acetylglucosamine 1-carboxyvinyltransferase
MQSFEIIGGKKLKGEITPQGAKNEALQIISAVLLTDQVVRISNIPDIVDVNKLIDLLQDMGVKVVRESKDTYTFQADQIDQEYFKGEVFKQKGSSLRGSVMIVGPLLARFKRAFIPRPGGDKIGRRRLDTHFLGFEKLGAKFSYDQKDSFFSVDATELKGAYMLLDEASVTGTANILMAAVLAKGTTTIYNAACEPYIQQLCKMLNAMGEKLPVWVLIC